MKSAQPLKVTLISKPEFPLETLFYVWEQSRSNKPVPSPWHLNLMRNAGDNVTATLRVNAHGVNQALGSLLTMMGFDATPGGHKTFVDKFNYTVDMILHESIPVTENLQFVFHFENIPISLREQMVRHRIGTTLGPNISFDIIPDLAESTWWSQTSRVIPFSEFFDEGRYLLPETLHGKRVQDEVFVTHPSGNNPDHEVSVDYKDRTVDAEDYYKDTLQLIQYRYKMLQAAGVHIEDCRQIIPVGATHGITWGINLKAMLHIFGKRASWIAQAGLWEDAISQMIGEMIEIDPIFKDLGLPMCIKKGKYVGCPVNGTNVERVQGIDGMPPCPLWVRYQTNDALNAWADGTDLGHKGWSPPSLALPDGSIRSVALSRDDIRNWTTNNEVEKEMLTATAAKFSKLWHLDVYNPNLNKAA